MTSKRELRERLQDALDSARDAWDNGFATAEHIIEGRGPYVWTKHLARVADAARAEGRRAGWTEAWTAGAYVDEDAYSRGYAAAVADWQIIRLPEPTPEPAGGCQGDVSPDAACCGFACCCQHPPVAGWTPGSVTR